MTGSFPAEKIGDLVENILSVFNLSIKEHIIASATNEASVMKKFGRLRVIEHQLCYAHGLHLAVCEVLYKSQTPQRQNVLKAIRSCKTLMKILVIVIIMMM